MNRPLVLIVEDDPLLLAALELKFEQETFDIRIAKNVREARDVVSSSSPDVILLDLIMPSGDGMGFLRWLRNEKQNRVPVIVMTNLDKEDAREEAKKLGASDFLIKTDTSIGMVADKVHRILQGSTPIDSSLNV